MDMIKCCSTWSLISMSLSLNDQQQMGKEWSIQYCFFFSCVFQFYGSRFNTGSLYAQCFIVLTDFWLILRTQLLSSLMFVNSWLIWKILFSRCILWNVNLKWFLTLLLILDSIFFEASMLWCTSDDLAFDLGKSHFLKPL